MLQEPKWKAIFYEKAPLTELVDWPLLVSMAVLAEKRD